MLEAAQMLTGERHAPELPIPHSAIRQFAEERHLAPQIVGLVAHYDAAVRVAITRETKNGARASKS